MTSRRSYRGAFLELVTERVTLPGGATAELDVIRHPGAAAILPFATDDDVLLLKQYRYAAGGTIFEVPAGKLDDGEDPATCAARELEEEAGQRCGRLVELAAIWTTPGFTDERIHLFAAFDLEPVAQRLDRDEVIQVVRMPFRAALELVWSGELSDAKSALTLIHAARWLGRLT